MLSFSFLDVACPTLSKIPHVLVVHGEGDGTLDHMKVCLFFFFQLIPTSAINKGLVWGKCT